LLHFLFLLRLPPPQFLEHSLQGPHGLHLVSGGQSWTLQNKTIVEGPGQGLFSVSSRDLALGGTLQVRYLFLVPPPQVWLHSVHSDQSDHSGSGKHGFTLQSSVSSDCPEPQGLARLKGLYGHILVLVLEPPPQVLVQLDQGDHSVHDGHLSWLHFLSSNADPLQSSFLLFLHSLALC